MGVYSDNLQVSNQEAIAELYTFTMNDVIERFTSFSRDLVFLGHPYTAASIARSGITFSSDFSISELTISAPITDHISEYLSSYSIKRIQVNIYRALASDLTDYVLFFSGDVQIMQLKDYIVSIKCVSKFRILEIKIPDIVYQSFCNHDVFDAGCALQESDYFERITTTESVGYTLSFPTVVEIADGYFTGGRAKLIDRNEIRLITRHTAITTLEHEIDLHIPFNAHFAVGDELFLYPGCDGDPATCVNRYSNLIHYLGTPYIPSKNPVVWGFR